MTKPLPKSTPENSTVIQIEPEPYEDSVIIQIEPAQGIAAEPQKQNDQQKSYKNSFAVLRAFVSLACFITPLYFQNKNKTEFNKDDPRDIVALGLIFIASAMTTYETIKNSIESLQERKKVFSKEENKNLSNSALELARNTLACLILPAATVGSSLAIGASIVNPTEETNKVIFQTLRYFGMIGISSASVFNAIDLLQYQNVHEKPVLTDPDAATNNEENQKTNNSKLYNYASMAANMSAAVASVILLLETDKSNQVQNTVILAALTTSTKLWSSYLKNKMLPNDAKKIDAVYTVVLGVASAFASAATCFDKNSPLVESLGGFTALNAMASQFDSVLSSFRGLVDSEIAKAIQKNNTTKSPSTSPESPNLNSSFISSGLNISRSSIN